MSELKVCPNCGQWQRPENHGDCVNECARRGFAKPAREWQPHEDPRRTAYVVGLENWKKDAESLLRACLLEYDHPQFNFTDHASMAHKLRTFLEGGK